MEIALGSLRAYVVESEVVLMSSPSKASILIRWLENCWKKLVESYYYGHELPVRIIRPSSAHGSFQTTGMAGSFVSIS